jgi:hypothetical protein
MVKAAFNKKMAPFTSTPDVRLGKKPVKCYIWSTTLYGAETWTLPAVDQKHLERFEMEKIIAKTTNTCTEFYHSFIQYTGSYMFRQCSAIIRELLGFV